MTEELKFAEEKYQEAEKAIRAHAAAPKTPQAEKDEAEYELQYLQELRSWVSLNERQLPYKLTYKAPADAPARIRTAQKEFEAWKTKQKQAFGVEALYSV